MLLLHLTNTLADLERGQPTDPPAHHLSTIVRRNACLLYALNTFAFTDKQSMRVWFSCRTQSQRHQVRSLKLPSAVTGYYRSPHNISLAAVYPQLKTIYIDLWRVVEMENEIDDTSEEDVVRLLAEEKVKAQKKEGGDVKIVATEHVYI